MDEENILPNKGLNTPNKTNNKSNEVDNLNEKLVYSLTKALLVIANQPKREMLFMRILR